jgi:hypothetical protein
VLSEHYYFFKTKLYKPTIMKNILMSFLFGFLVLATACTPANTEGEATDETMEEMADEATDDAAEAKVVASTESYTTKITEDGIASPRKMMSGTIGDAEIMIDYGSPAVKGRTVWGDLEKFGTVWRAGANSATIIEFSGDVTIEGEALPAGKYALFVIPNADNAVVIFNKVTDQWGAGKYDEAEDALRVTVAPQPQETNTWS